MKAKDIQCKDESRLSNVKLVLEKWSVIYDHGDEADELTSGVAAKKVEFCTTSARTTEEEEYSEAAAEDKVELTLKKNTTVGCS